MPESEFRYAAFEIREGANGLGIVTGVIIRYGDVATLPWGTEEFRAGAFGDFSGEQVYANRMHERSQPLGWLGGQLSIDDNAERMQAELKLPDTSAGRDVSVEVSPAVRILRGLSLEFRAIEDTVNQDTGHRTISKAKLYGFGVVDRPAYPGSVAGMRSWNEYRTAHNYLVPDVETRVEPRELAEAFRFLAV